VSKAYRAAAALKVGTIWVNAYSMFDPASLFGGYKQVRLRARDERGGY
jgi:acyl-CoA reductase-like NAD-dependent aldehyde dehydrogenase